MDFEITADTVCHLVMLDVEETFYPWEYDDARQLLCNGTDNVDFKQGFVPERDGTPLYVSAQFQTMKRVCQLPSGAESKNRICLRSVRICAVRARPVVPCRQFWLFAVLYALNHRQAPLVPPSRSPLLGPWRVSQLHTPAFAVHRSQRRRTLRRRNDRSTAKECRPCPRA